MENAGKAVSRHELLDRVWGEDWMGDPRTLDVHICWLREKLEENPSAPRDIQTWAVHYHGGDCAVPVDLVGFWHPALKNCPTKHYDHQAGKQRPAIVLGVVGRVGALKAQRRRA